MHCMDGCFCSAILPRFNLVVLPRLPERLSLLRALVFSLLFDPILHARLLEEVKDFYFVELIDLMWVPLNYLQNHNLLHICLWCIGLFRRSNEHGPNDLDASILRKLSASNPAETQPPFFSWPLSLPKLRLCYHKLCCGLLSLDFAMIFYNGLLAVQNILILTLIRLGFLRVFFFSGGGLSFDNGNILILIHIIF